MAEGDHIRLFENKEQRTEVIPVQRWEGFWPPPERIGLLTGKSGMAHSILTAPEGEQEVRDHIGKQGREFDDLFDIRWFTRESYSKISEEDIVGMSHVARGAAYVPEVSE